MKKLMTALSGSLFILAACGSLAQTPATSGTTSGTGTASGSTAGVLCDYSESTYNADESVKATSTAKWACSTTERTLSANGLPDHEVGTFPNASNPNTILAQTVAAKFTLTPTKTETATELGGPRGATAMMLNGVKADPGTAGTCDDTGTNCSEGGGNGGTWRMEALDQTSFNFGADENNAHVQPGGTYHYHGMPEGLIKTLNSGKSDNAMTLIGWAADGFPVYARYGHTTATDASSSLTAMKGSYQLKATPDANRPATTVYAMGTFQQDYQYVAGSGDLDECNGRTDVTPEFPNGTYHYYATDTYPYLPRCVKGEVTVTNPGPPAGQNRPGAAPARP